MALKEMLQSSNIFVLNVFIIPVIVTFVSLITLFSYPCNPYKDFDSLDSNDSYDYCIQNPCSASRACWQDCKLYKLQLELLLNQYTPISEGLDIDKSGIIINHAKPNPFCFVSQSTIDKFKLKKSQWLENMNGEAVSYEVGLTIARDANNQITFSAISSILCIVFQLCLLVLWLEYSGECSSILLVFTISMIIIAHSSSYWFQSKASKFLVCNYDVINPKVLGAYEIKPFCDNTVGSVVLPNYNDTIMIRIFQISLGLKKLNICFIILGGVFSLLALLK